MATITLRDLYLAELTDLFAAEQLLLYELPLLAAGATAAELREAFDAHYLQTQQHLERLARIFRALDERPRGGTCRALRAIVDDARTRNGHVDRTALDGALIAVGQRIEHYEIAGYRSARTYAVSLDDLAGADVLQETLDEEGGMDRRLVELAMAGSLTTPGHHPRVLSH
jgi:ferritin-like metal-binding protein YciE